MNLHGHVVVDREWSGQKAEQAALQESHMQAYSLAVAAALEPERL
jgi:hypothetical protein